MLDFKWLKFPIFYFQLLNFRGNPRLQVSLLECLLVLFSIYLCEISLDKSLNLFDEARKGCIENNRINNDTNYTLA